MEKISLENSAVLIINMQTGIKRLCKEFEQIVPQQKNLLEECKKKHIPVAICEFFSGGKTSPEVTEGTKGSHSVRVFAYHDHSIFGSRDFNLWLKNKKIKTLIFCGMFAKSNIKDTAKEAINRGFKIVASKDLMTNHSLNYGEEESKNDFSWYAENGTLTETCNDLLEQYDIVPHKKNFFFSKKVKSAFV